MYRGWEYFSYTPVSQRRKKSEDHLKKLRKAGHDIEPVVIEGNTLARSWWGKAWNSNLSLYSDYYNRLGRGRSYVRHGAVVDLKIREKSVTAMVSGTSLYRVAIKISALKREKWNLITEKCSGKFDSLRKLLDGKFPKEFKELFTTPGSGLFPSAKEIHFECSCPDRARMCKHVAAVLYGIGSKLDSNPALFFSLRGVKIDDLISGAVKEKTSELLRKAKNKTGRVMSDVSVSKMFGIEIDDAAKQSVHGAGRPKPKSKARVRAGKKPRIKALGDKHD
ncbi:MAG: SWIM zinc finger family protein [Oligoflexia bacterium]|nr:SWIM zinc finger family protein [Oligoflexia bacterium]